MRLLVLGGTAFVGRALVEEGLHRGWEVTTFNRGRGNPVSARVERLTGDRTRPEDLAALHGREWDAVADTWAGAPRAVLAAARAVAGRVDRYLYVSSRSVYAEIPIGADESSPVVDASADADATDYACDKRGGELAALEVFGERALLARAGLILGPHEDVGRLPWWLLRMDRGGPVLAPGPHDLPLQYVDARDLAGWMLSGVVHGIGGAYDVVSPRGHATMGWLLEACRVVTGARASLVWVEPERVLAAGVQPWDEVPVWVPPGHPHEGLHGADVSKALAAGLRCRPVEQTVADTWTWLLAEDKRPRLRSDRHFLDPGKEAALLAAD